MNTGIMMELKKMMGKVIKLTAMVAAAPKANDVPDRPYFVNIDVEEEDEPKPVVVAPKPIAIPKKKEEAKPVVATPITKRPQTSPLTPTYRPAFVPPTPVVPVVKKEEPKVDLSKVSVGCTVSEPHRIQQSWFPLRPYRL